MLYNWIESRKINFGIYRMIRQFYQFWSDYGNHLSIWVSKTSSVLILFGALRNKSHETGDDIITFLNKPLVDYLTIINTMNCLYIV